MNVKKTPIIRVKNLSVTLSNNPVLEQVSFNVQPQTIHAIVGSNGAGKTTLIRSLLGRMPHKGDIRFFFQKDRAIGYVPQFVEFDHALPITVGDFFHLMLTRKPLFLGRSEKIERKIIGLLAKTNCEYLINRPMGSLSGGELRKILITQALKKRPAVLLLDEPDSNMDASSARNFEDLLINLRDEHGMTLLLVGHDLEMVSRIADHVTCINKTVTFSGSVDDFHQHNSLTTLSNRNAMVSENIGLMKLAL